MRLALATDIRAWLTLWVRAQTLSLGASSNTPSTVDPNAYQYGGQAGGAAQRQGQLSQLGAQGASTAGQSPFQNAQLSALGQAQRQANGEDFGATQAALNQGLAQGQAGAAAQAAGARGGGAGLAAAQNQAANTQAGMAASTANTGAAMKAAQQAQGVQNLNSFASGGLGQAMQGNEFNASLQQGYENMNDQTAQAQLQAQQNEQQQNSQNQLQAQQMASQQGQANAQAQSGAIGSLIGAGGSAISSIGSLFSSSDENMKTNILDQSGSSPIGAPAAGAGAKKPGGGDMFDARTYTQSGGNAIGESQLAAQDAHTANFAQLGTGMGDWVNKSNAKPFSPASDAADANLNKYFFNGSGQAGLGSQGQPNASHFMLSDTRAKKDAIREDAKNEALSQQAAQLRDALDSHTQGFEWMNDSAPAVQNDDDRFADVISGGQSDPYRNLQRSDDGPQNVPQAYMESIKPKTFNYKDARMNGGERRLGFMAQDLEKSPTGGDLVHDTPAGKVVDVPALASANAASVADLHQDRKRPRGPDRCA